MYPNQADDQTKRKRKIYIGIGVAVLLLIVLVVLFSHNSGTNKPVSNSNSSSYYDTNSGKTVRTIKGEHGNTGVASSTPLFLGADQLLGAGLTTDQLANVETAFFRYSAKQTKPISKVSITKDSVEANIVNRGTPQETAELDFMVELDDGARQKATVQYSGFEQIELFLYNTSGKQIFDSGTVSDVAR